MLAGFNPTLCILQVAFSMAAVSFIPDLVYDSFQTVGVTNVPRKPFPHEKVTMGRGLKLGCPSQV